MYGFVDRDRPLDDNFNEPMHESWLHMQDANSKYHGTFAMFYKLDTLTLTITHLTDRLRLLHTRVTSSKYFEKR